MKKLIIVVLVATMLMVCSGCGITQDCVIYTHYHSDGSKRVTEYRDGELYSVSDIQYFFPKENRAN